MSRVANNPVTIPQGVEVVIENGMLTAKGGKSALSQAIHPSVLVVKENDVLTFKENEGFVNAGAHAGTCRALVNNMLTGLSRGFEKRLTLIGVGYRAQVQGNKVNLTLGFSHPVVYELPEGISAETPSQTEIVIKGVSKQLVGQVAAEIRAYRPPEPYKGKGVRYADEHVIRKEGKKK
ncbi:MAG: 50S ribosomal protein L6 [Gammaproteobacteria bacterium]|nr:50S ribosomal protein L6 [Gammaproteobacteria bacterium]